MTSSLLHTSHLSPFLSHFTRWDLFFFSSLYRHLLVPQILTRKLLVESTCPRDRLDTHHKWKIEDARALRAIPDPSVKHAVQHEVNLLDVIIVQEPARDRFLGAERDLAVAAEVPVTIIAGVPVAL